MSELNATESSLRLPLYGINASAVIDCIKKRAQSLNPTDYAKDGRKIGLVIEGGGMRGVCSGGGAVALAYLGFTELFDEVYATSAGVMNASYFLSKQPDLGITVYYDCLATRRFMNPLRLWKMLDVDYIFDSIVITQKPLNLTAIYESRPKFYVAVLDKLTGEGRIVDAKCASYSILTALKAATAMPVFYNRCVDLAGRPSMDAGLRIPFPIHFAIKQGCTDILVLLTRPQTYISRKPSWHNRLLFSLICSRGNRGLYDAFASHHKSLALARGVALGHNLPESPINIATICTDEPETVGRLTSDRAALRHAAVLYGRKIMTLFGRNGCEWDLAPLVAHERP